MAPEKTLRHVEGLVKDILEAGEAPSVLRRALEAALAAIMEAEVSELAGAQHGERSATRQAHRNGYRERRFDTGLGTSSLEIPRLREGSYMPSFLKSRQRSDDALMLALVQCYQQGVSTRNAEAIAQVLGIETISKSAVSRLPEALDPQVEEFRKRRLPACPYVFVDARYENVREHHRVQKMAVLVALGVSEDGAREVLGFGVAPVENEAYWEDFLLDLRKRGLSGVQLVISDGHEGLKRAIERALPSARWQRCKVHFLRNLGSRVPQKRRPALLALTKTIFEQETLEDALAQRQQVADAFRRTGQADAASFLESADEILTYLSFPAEHRKKIHSTNVVERLNRELKRRTRVVSIFPNRDSVVRLAGALLLEEHDEWTVGRRYISEQSMKLLQRSPPGAAAVVLASGERRTRLPAVSALRGSNAI
jgi:putative transposase